MITKANKATKGKKRRLVCLRGSFESFVFDIARKVQTILPQPTELTSQPSQVSYLTTNALRRLHNRCITVNGAGSSQLK
jgi:hypothetical protein